MGLARGRLKDLCDAVLLAIVTGWPLVDAETSGPVEPLLARRYVANGQVFWDCEQLVVSVERVFGSFGDPAFQQLVETNVPPILGFRGATVAIQLLRCVPDMTDTAQGGVVFPEPADIEASADAILGDAVLILNLLIDAQDAGLLATCQGLSFQDWTPAGPDGGFGGGVTRVLVELL